VSCAACKILLAVCVALILVLRFALLRLVFLWLRSWCRMCTWLFPALSQGQVHTQLSTRERGFERGLHVSAIGV
jgi:hypothetical protein